MKRPDHYLRSYFSEGDGEFVIEGNDAGLTYLIEVVQHILRNELGTPAAHWHFMDSNYLLERGSPSFQIARVAG